MSYSSGEGLEKMTGAVKAWEDEQRKPAEQQMSMKKFAKAWEIPFSTLQNHVCPMCFSRRLPLLLSRLATLFPL
jgi:hypothetical protein